MSAHTSNSPRSTRRHPTGSHLARRRSRRLTSCLVACLLALVLAACAAPAALAQPAGEEDDTVAFGCSSVTFTFTGFPHASGNRVSEFVYIDGKTLLTANFSFDGPNGSNSLKVVVPPGHHSMDAFGKWDTNGIRGGRDRKDAHGIVCSPAPSFSIELLQRIKGSGAAFIASPLSGEVGQTTDYAIVLTNTGNVALSFATFSDPGCDGGTITGGPGTTPVPPGGSTTYFCEHLLTLADQLTGLHQNVVSVTALSSEGGTIVSSHTSNTVVVSVPKPPPPPPPPAGPGPAPPAPQPTPGPTQPRASVASVQAAAGAPSPVAHAGRLGLFAGVPMLIGQEGCARSGFAVSVASPGVRSVTFSLDRHRLATLTARNARSGRLSTRVDPARLTLGAHTLIARITMAAPGSTARPVAATRALTFLRCDPPTVAPKFAG
jgi:hypothetical protein